MSDPAARALDGKVAIVTGGSRGIGFAAARALAAAGARVALLARSPGPLAEAAARLGDAALAVPADVSDPESVRAAVARVGRELGRLDVLVNSAVLAWPRTLAEVGDDELRAMVDTNFLGVLYTMRAALPLMRASGGGEIVNVSSESVRHPFPLLSVYAATKAAVEMLSRALKRELGAEGVRVSVLRSGAVLGGGFVSGWSPEEIERAVTAWQQGGYLDFVGTPMPPEAIADSIVHVVTRPRGASVDLLEIRSS